MYRDRMTIRQLWARIRALPYGSPLHEALAEAGERAAAERKVADVEDALNRYR